MLLTGFENGLGLLHGLASVDLWKGFGLEWGEDEDGGFVAKMLLGFLRYMKGGA